MDRSFMLYLAFWMYAGTKRWDEICVAIVST